MTSRMKRFVLIGSVLLNVFFISWLGSQWVKNRHASYSWIGRTVEQIPEAARPVFLKHLQGNKQELMSSLQQLVEGHEEVNRLSRETELDSAALEQAFSQGRDNLNNSIILLQSAMLAALQEMPLDVRNDWVKGRQQKTNQFAQTLKDLASELEKY